MGYTPLRRGAGRLFDENLNRMLRELYDLSQSLFAETQTVERTPIITLSSTFGTSALRDIETVTGSGAISATGGEIILSTGATATSAATLETAKIGTYIPGFSAQVGVGMRIPTLPTGNQVVTWGGLSNAGNDGFYFGVDATGPFVARLDNGTETITRQSDWNGDKLDGTGDSRVTLDLAFGLIFQIDYAYYGHGPIEFSTYRLVNGTNRRIVLHRLQIDEQVSVQDPNLAVFAKTDNGGDAVDIDAYVGGRQFSIMGEYRPNIRSVGQERGSVATSTSVTPLVSFRRKSGFGNRGVLVDDVTVDVGTEPVIVEAYVNGSLTGASWATPANATAAETSLEADSSASAISGGTLIFSKYFAAGRGNARILDRDTIGTDLPRNQPVTICARTLTGTGTITTHAVMAEEW